MSDVDKLRDKYIDRLADFDAMVDECKAALDDAMTPMQRETWKLMSRVKEPASFLIKALFRGKPYSDPMTEIEDIAGVRLIVSDLRDVRQAERIVQSALTGLGWDVGPPDNKRITEDDDSAAYEVRYRGTHFIARDPVRGDLPLEVQIHTKAESAWATASHSLIYKPLIELPGEYKRRVKRLLALVELFDEQVDTVQTMVDESPDIEAIKLFRWLEERYFDLTGRDPTKTDPLFGIENTRQMLSVASSAEVKQLVDDLVSNDGSKLRKFYDTHASEGRVLLASQPESLALIALAKGKRISLERAVLEHAAFDPTLLSRLAASYGVGLDLQP